MASENVQTKRVGDLQYEIKLRLVKKGLHDGINYQNDVVYIDYTVKNLGAKNYLVFNRGHNDKSEQTNVYVESLADGGIELSQKAFAQPKDKNWPLRDAPILPRASWLKAGQTVKAQVSADPLQLNTPFNDCSPQPMMPKEIKTVKFCLGVVEADPKGIQLSDDGSIKGDYDIGQQQLLCSELISLK